MGVSAGFALLGASLAFAIPAAPACTPTHRCHHVLHLGPTGTRTAHASWDSDQRFRPGPLAVAINYSPHLATDQGVHTQPIGDCSTHFVLPARFTGFVSRCGTGKLPLHVQFANVTLKHLRIGVTYWTPAPLFTG
jgi:hypothetical protein